MDISLNGGNCLTLTTKKAQVVIDDNLAELGGQTVKKADIRLYSHDMLKPKTAVDESFIIDGPGEYEISHVSVIGIPARAHMDEEGKHSATIYKVIAGGTSIAVIGHVHPNLSNEQLEQIGIVDIVAIPVGGAGYTLDPIGATKLIKKIEPKAVIPTHYKMSGMKYEVPQGELSDFLTEIGAEATKEEKLKTKNGLTNENLTVYQLA